MSIQPISTQLNLNIFRKNDFFSCLREAFVPIKRETLNFVTQKPMASTGAFLTFLGFLSGIVNKSTEGFMPACGVGAIGSFICQLFCIQKDEIKKVVSSELKESKRTTSGSKPAIGYDIIPLEGYLKW